MKIAIGQIWLRKNNSDIHYKSPHYKITNIGNFSKAEMDRFCIEENEYIDAKYELGKSTCTLTHYPLKQFLIFCQYDDELTNLETIKDIIE